MAAYKNIHGRKWGRGLRPWLLIPKYFAVAILVGGLFALGVLAIASTFATTEAQSRGNWMLVRSVFRYQVIPAAAAAVVLGVLLLMQHRREFLRMRWMRTKLALIIIAVPLMHFWLRSKVIASSSQAELLPAILTALALFALIAVIGRLKPRLWQRYNPAP